MSWFQFIVDDIRTRAATGKPLPSDTTLQGLAEHYQVSTTPVRLAVQLLVEEEVLIRDKRNGVRLAPDYKPPQGKPRRATPPKPPVNHYNLIANDLMHQSLYGEEVFVRETEAARRYGVSGTIIRQVFNRLAGAGVIEHVQRRGWRLKPLKQKDLDDFAEIRAMMERKAVQLAWPRLVTAELQEMHDANRLPESDGDDPTIDDRLHDYFATKSDNLYIREFFSKYLERQSRYYLATFYWWSSTARDIKILTVRQHRQILQAALDGAKNLACDLLEEHIWTNHPILTRLKEHQLEFAKHRDTRWDTKEVLPLNGARAGKSAVKSAVMSDAKQRRAASSA